MSAEEHEKLKASMRRFGIVDPFIVRRRDNLVIGGHQRLEDALELGFARVPIVRIDATEREVKALNLALNKISGDWDEDKLASILSELQASPEINLTGFDQAEIDKLIADAELPNLNDSASGQKSPRLSLVPYLGGKQKLVPQLVSMMPQHTAFVEVFGGGASVLLNKPRSEIEVLNDLDGELVNLFETIRDNPDGFLKRADMLLYSRELFERWQQEFTGGESSTQDPVERALRFWYVLRCSFGAQAGKGWAFTRAEPRNGPLVLQNALEQIQPIHERLKSVEIDHLDFRRCIENRDAPTTFLFLDPPYLDTEQYRVGKFTLDDHKALAEVLQNAKGKWLMTVGDHPEVRELYPGQVKGALDSSLAVEQVIGGERGTYRNLIVSNYPLPQQVLQVAE
jgi:DNA adenine methylase